VTKVRWGGKSNSRFPGDRKEEKAIGAGVAFQGSLSDVAKFGAAARILIRPAEDAGVSGRKRRAAGLRSRMLWKGDVEHSGLRKAPIALGGDHAGEDRRVPTSWAADLSRALRNEPAG